MSDCTIIYIYYIYSNSHRKQQK